MNELTGRVAITLPPEPSSVVIRRSKAWLARKNRKVPCETAAPTPTPSSVRKASAELSVRGKTPDATE
jgi:hypothetical protein